MRHWAVLGVIALVLAGCGADGEPERPDPPAKPTTNVGVSLSTSGYASVGVSVTQGPFTLGMGF